MKIAEQPFSKTNYILNQSCENFYSHIDKTSEFEEIDGYLNDIDFIYRIKEEEKENCDKCSSL